MKKQLNTKTNTVEKLYSVEELKEILSQTIPIPPSVRAGNQIYMGGYVDGVATTMNTIMERLNSLV